MSIRYFPQIPPIDRTVSVFLALMVLSLSLRGPLVAITPVVHDMADGMHASLAAIGLLSSIPLLCFGLLAPVASRVIARLGVENAFILTAAGTALGMLIRPTGGMSLAIAGTVVMGASLAIGNIVSLMEIARDFPGRKAVVTSCFTAASILGTVLTSAFTAPLAERLGWRVALAAWALLALAAAGMWWRLHTLQRREAAAAQPRSGAAQPKAIPATLWRRPVVRLLTIIFATHLFIIFGLLAWYPAFLIHADRMSAAGAGFAASIMQLFSLGGAFLSPWLVRRLPLVKQLLVIGLFWFVTPLWMLAAPGQWLLWSMLVGFNQGAGFVVVFTLVMQHSIDLADNRRMSAAVQGVGYTVAAAAPVALGALLQLNGQWMAPLGLLAALSVVVIAAAVALARLPAAPSAS